MSTTLVASPRKDAKRSTTKAVRKEGKIPAIVYGKGIETQAIAVDALELTKTLREHGRNALLNLQTPDGAEHAVLVQEIQTDAIRRDWLHVDFHKVSMTEKIDIEVPVVLTGTAIGEKDGGVVDHTLREVTINVLPTEIPEVLEYDISELNIGDVVTVNDLKEKYAYDYVTEGDEAIVSIVPPTELGEVDVDADESAEPEVIGEKTEEE
ncbi:MAG TPA: 50S ribosomal protein L25/general stress protein Ctc [Massilibacterium sp.]|nr:50S ribosomal protein L25/general stress protein Ctc [Massilibacterium sp.]